MAHTAKFTRLAMWWSAWRIRSIPSLIRSHWVQDGATTAADQGGAQLSIKQGGEQPDTYNYPDGPTLIREVAQAAKVLAEEETVQRALEVEKKALYASSSFIPTLKVPGD